MTTTGGSQQAPKVFLVSDISSGVIFWIIVLAIAIPVFLAGKRKSDDEANKQAQRQREIFLAQQRVILEKQDEINRLRRESGVGNNDDAASD